MHNLGVFHINNLYYLVYRNKSVREYKKELEDNKELAIDNKCVEFFNELIIDIPDGFEMYIKQVGNLYDTNKPAYGIIAKNEEGIWFNRLFVEEIFDDEKIEKLINSLCEVLHKKNYKNVIVSFLVLFNKTEYEQYYDDYKKEVE